jgi:ubiquinone/menaquinone biosynthesis C-methylase UbiE
VPLTTNPIVETYSRLARKYDDEVNQQSCWGLAAEKVLASLVLKDDYQVVLDVGCGTGRALIRLASQSRPGVQFIGIDPAKNMGRLALQRTKSHACIRILDGSFEKIPLESASVDYLYSIFAFHWTVDLDAAVSEISRVLKPTGEMDLFFIGRNNGREFIRRTSPIFLKYMGPALFLDSARMRKQLTREAALHLFTKAFPLPQLSVEELNETYYDTLEGHWGWWVRIEGHFMKIPAEKREECNREVRHTLQSLMEEKGIPYTIHQLHVKLRRVRIG